MSVATLTVTSDGTAMDPAVQVLSVAVTKVVNRIGSAEITLIDGDPAAQEFPMSDGAFFEPGSEVEIKLRYEGENDHSVFTGVVVGQRIDASRRGSSLTVELKDPAVALTDARHSAVFSEKKDSEIITQLIRDAGLTAGTVPATESVHAEVVQFRSTDWDFLLSRADVNGLLVVADAGTVDLAPFEVSGSATTTFDLGMTPVFDLEVELDGTAQADGYESVGWDPSAQKMTAAQKAGEPTSSLGNLTGKKVAERLRAEVRQLTSSAALAPEELKAWAEARLARNRMALIRGRISVPGQGDLGLLDVIEVTGVGDRLGGTTMITGISHRLDGRGWVTDVQFGVPPATFSEEPGIAEPGAAGLLPPVGGLQIGVVAAFEEDPSDERRVRVVVPGIAADTGAVWARLAAPDAGEGRGWFFRPEPDDEVVLGFLDDDPRQPVILGSLYSSARTPPEDMAVDEENLLRGIVTRSGTKLVFSDDEKASVTIETPGANSIVVDDDAEQIVVTDQHGNTVTMSADGVSIVSKKDLELSADGDVKISAGGNVEIAGSKVDVK